MSTRVLAIYRGKLTDNRGTPIRVRSILEGLAKDPRFALTIATWDQSLPFSDRHIHLTNRKIDDFRAVLGSISGGR
jgi:hypothetical protein